MELWQIVLAAVFVLPPFVLLGVFHARRERLSSRGKPLSRMWQPTAAPAPAEDEHH
jgi:hypothetical protein